MGKTLDKLHIAGFYVSVRHIRGVVLDFDAATMKLEFNRFGGYCWDHPHAKAEESIQAFLRLFSVNIAAIQDSSWRPPRNVSPLSAITRDFVRQSACRVAKVVFLRPEEMCGQDEVAKVMGGCFGCRSMEAATVALHAFRIVYPGLHAQVLAIQRQKKPEDNVKVLQAEQPTGTLVFDEQKFIERLRAQMAKQSPQPTVK